MRSIVEIAALWILPLALLIEYQFWQSIAWATPVFIFYVIAVPALAAYIIVATGAGWLKLWKFNLKYTVGKVPIQIGLVYSSVINFFLLIFAGLLSPPSSISLTVLTSILIAVSGAILGSLYDIALVHYRFLEVYIRPFYKREKTIKIVAAYGPWFFGLMGFAAGLSVKFGEYLLIETNQFISLGMVIAVGTLIIYAPFLFYFLFIIEHKRHKAENRNKVEGVAETTSS